MIYILYGDIFIPNMNLSKLDGREIHMMRKKNLLAKTLTYRLQVHISSCSNVNKLNNKNIHEKHTHTLKRQDDFGGK